MGHKEVLMADAVNSFTVDCMGKRVKASDFCKKQFPKDKLLTRGYLNLEKDELLCQFGHRVLLTVSCDERDLKYCAYSAKKGCTELKEIFALALTMIHYSILREKDVHHLHCYFSSEAE